MIQVKPPRINFSEEWNKLIDLGIGNIFHTVRWIDKKPWYTRLMDEERDLEVVVQGEPRYMLVVTDVRSEQIMNLTRKFVEADTYPGMTVPRFYDLLANWYVKKPDWSGWESWVVIIYMMVTEVL